MKKYILISLMIILSSFCFAQTDEDLEQSMEDAQNQLLQILDDEDGSMDSLDILQEDSDEYLQKNEEIEKDDVAGSANITNLADYVTTISRAKDDVVEYDAILKILKNRHTGVNVGKKLMFNLERKRFYSAETEKELNRRYFDNLEQINIDNWENI